MEDLYKKLNDTLKENTSLKHQMVDIQSELNAKEQELMMIKESNGIDQYLKRITMLEKENAVLRDMIDGGDQNEVLSENIKENPRNSEDELRQYLRTIREYVTGLIGYKMEFKDGEIIFHSLYAFDVEDVFIFRYKSGSMELINNEFARTWTNEVQNYLIVGKSIPAFLAAVTLELFNKKTFG